MLHTVFCAECTADYDYKSIGVFYSHNLSGMPGGITRLLACDEAELKTYRGLHLGPTFVHQNHKRIWHTRALRPGETAGQQWCSSWTKGKGARCVTAVRNDSSGSYNKPGSIMHWVHEAPEAKRAQYVLYIDADMLLRKPMDPIVMGVRKGVVVSEHVRYLDVGLRNGLARRFLSAELEANAIRDLDKYQIPPCHDARCSAGSREPKAHAAAGWYHFFHMEDIRKVAPRWYHWEREMRLNPQHYWRITDADGVPGGVAHDIQTGDIFAQSPEPPWISEMYGYAFAAAEAGLQHILTDGVVVYPDDIGAGHFEEAHLIHYGLDCSVGAHFRFTKKVEHSAVNCTGELFGEPPQPTHLERLCAETVWTINDALCEHYSRPAARGGCGLPADGRQPPRCPGWRAFEPMVCGDSEAHCSQWASSGECKANEGFMQRTCAKACGFCDDERKHTPAWARGLAIARGETPLPMKPPTELTAAEQITLSYSVGGPAWPDRDVDEGAERPTNGSGHATSHAPLSHAASHSELELKLLAKLKQQKQHLKEDLRHEGQTASHAHSHAHSHAPASEVTSHAPASHAPASQIGSRAASRGPASLPMLASTEWPWLWWVGIAVICAGIVVSRHVLGRLTKRKLIMDPDGKDIFV